MKITFLRDRQKPCSSIALTNSLYGENLGSNPPPFIVSKKKKKKSQAIKYSLQRPFFGLQIHDKIKIFHACLVIITINQSHIPKISEVSPCTAHEEDSKRALTISVTDASAIARSVRKPAL